MEEKERYSWYNHSTEEIYDNKENIVFVGAITVLNQQNRRIWELIEENNQLKQQLEEMQNEKNELISKYRYWRGECCELKQQLHDLPKNIVEEIKIEMGGIEDILINCGNGKEDALSWFNKILQTILKNYEVNKNE